MIVGVRFLPPWCSRIRSRPSKRYWRVFSVSMKCTTTLSNLYELGEVQRSNDICFMCGLEARVFCRAWRLRVYISVIYRRMVSPVGIKRCVKLRFKSDSKERKWVFLTTVNGTLASTIQLINDFLTACDVDCRTGALVAPCMLVILCSSNIVFCLLRAGPASLAFLTILWCTWRCLAADEVAWALKRVLQ